jgi:hypothetical protein
MDLISRIWRTQINNQKLFYPSLDGNFGFFGGKILVSGRIFLREFFSSREVCLVH